MDNFDREIRLLAKWNHRLLLKVPSMRFIELVLRDDPNKSPKEVKNEWFLKQIGSKNCFFKEPASMSSTYKVQTLSGRELLTYHIKNNDVHEFENDVKSVWFFLTDYCYDKEWWLKEYGQYHDGHPMQDLLLVRSEIIIGFGEKAINLQELENGRE
jgi:hypothetical protein